MIFIIFRAIEKVLSQLSTGCLVGFDKLLSEWLIFRVVDGNYGDVDYASWSYCQLKLL